MTQATDVIAVTPGAGADVAFITIGGRKYQVVIQADELGYVLRSAPSYRMFVPPQAVGANKVYFDLFNATGSGKKIRLLSVVPIVSGDVAVTGVLGVDLFLTRTTAVGTGGTAFAANGVGLNALAIAQMDPADAALPAQITARLAPAGGGTAGAVISMASVFTEETNAATFLAHFNDLVRRNMGPHGPNLIIPENTGIRVVQDTVASVGNIGFDVAFELI
jgi:hypothetical protein